MLYALDQKELERLRSADWTAEFPGAKVLTAVFRTDQAVLARILPRPLPVQDVNIRDEMTGRGAAN